MSQLQRYSSGEVPIPKNDRAVSQQAKVIFDQTRVAGFRVDGVILLAEHAMKRSKVLDQFRREQAQDDVTLNMMLVEIELEAFRQVKDVQRSMTDGWGLG